MKKKPDPTPKHSPHPLLVQVTRQPQIKVMKTTGRKTPISGFELTSGDEDEESVFEEMPDRVFEAIRSMTEKLSTSFQKVASACKPDERFGEVWAVVMPKRAGSSWPSGEAKQEFEVHLKWKMGDTPPHGSTEK